MELTPQVIVLVYNLYGWTGANHNKAAAARTNDLLEAMFSDIQAQPPGPALVVGDINGDLTTFSTINQQQQAGNIIDVGAHAQQCPPQNTKIHAKHQEPRSPAGETIC